MVLTPLNLLRLKEIINFPVAHPKSHAGMNEDQESKIRQRENENS
jgi:hypothetical protein